MGVLHICFMIPCCRVACMLSSYTPTAGSQASSHQKKKKKKISRKRQSIFLHSSKTNVDQSGVLHYLKFKKKKKKGDLICTCCSFWALTPATLPAVKFYIFHLKHIFASQAVPCREVKSLARFTWSRTFPMVHAGENDIFFTTETLRHVWSRNESKGLNTFFFSKREGLKLQHVQPSVAVVFL